MNILKKLEPIRQFIHDIASFVTIIPIVVSAIIHIDTFYQDNFDLEVNQIKVVDVSHTQK